MLRIPTSTPDLFDPERVECPNCRTSLYVSTRTTLPSTVSIQIMCPCGLVLEVAQGTAMMIGNK